MHKFKTASMNKIFQFTILLFFFSCSNDKTTKSNVKVSKNKKTEIQEPTCTVTEKKNPDNGTDPIIIQTCIWGQYKFVTVGSPDYKGRYSYEYEIYKTTDNKDIKVQNKDIFNSKVGDLEKLINSEIAKELNENRQYPDNAECLNDVGNPNFSINDMGITIDKKGRMEFNVSFGLGGACFNVDGASAKFSLKDINVYLK
jgi:hypothetical protein